MGIGGEAIDVQHVRMYEVRVRLLESSDVYTCLGEAVCSGILPLSLLKIVYVMLSDIV